MICFTLAMSEDALIRLGNLRKLGLGPADLSAAVGSSYQYWRDLLAGQKSFGEKAARKIEEALKLNRGWLDDAGATSPLQSRANNVTPAPKKGSVPLISTVRAGNWGEINDHQPDTDKRVDVRYSSPSAHAFALEVEGDSMVGEGDGPSFPGGTMVIVEPDRQAKPGDFVVAKDTLTQKATFKRLMTDGTRWYLKPLNRDYPTMEIDEPDKRVIGVAIEFWIGGKL